jgi:hypothetical protein
LLTTPTYTFFFCGAKDQTQCLCLLGKCCKLYYSSTWREWGVGACLFSILICNELVWFWCFEIGSGFVVQSGQEVRILLLSHHPSFLMSFGHLYFPSCTFFAHFSLGYVSVKLIDLKSCLYVLKYPLFDKTIFSPFLFSVSLSSHV